MNGADKTYDPTPARRIACIGLGTMGAPMAAHLQRSGHTVTVYNRTPAKALQWSAEYAGDCADTPRQAAQGAELVMCCVGNDEDLRQVLLGEQGAFAGMSPGSVLVDHTTASADVARELASASVSADRATRFLDLPTLA